MIRKFEKNAGTERRENPSALGETQEKKNLGPYFAFVSTGSKKAPAGAAAPHPTGAES